MKHSYELTPIEAVAILGGELVQRPEWAAVAKGTKFNVELEVRMRGDELRAIIVRLEVAS